MSVRVILMHRTEPKWEAGVRPSPELIAGMAIDDAAAWAARFAGIVGDVEIDIRPVTEPWDLGLMEKPASETTTRFMLADWVSK